MITYELALKLKDAGFPRDIRGRLGHATADWVTPDTPEGFLLAPTLSELIEACGDGFKGLFPPFVVEPAGWLAVEKIGSLSVLEDGGLEFTHWSFWNGSTPEEAVAELWLALNKKWNP